MQAKSKTDGSGMLYFAFDLGFKLELKKILLLGLLASNQF